MYSSYFIILFVVYVMGVDRGKFKTCQQSGFCSRTRVLKASVSKAEFSCLDVKLETVLKRFSFPLYIKDESLEKQHGFGKLAASLTVLDFDSSSTDTDVNMVRFQIEEIESLHKRFRTTDELYGKFDDREAFFVVKKCLDGVVELQVLNDSGKKVVVYSNPFKVEVLVNEVVMSVINGKNLLNFEVFREISTKKEHNEKEESNVDDAQYEEENQQEIHDFDDEQTMVHAEQGIDIEYEKGAEAVVNDWSEHFGSHFDPVKFGPSAISVDVEFPKAQHLYGIPEHADSFRLEDSLNGDPYRLYNLDVFEYELNSKMALYGAIPLIIATGKEGTVGCFWSNSAETWVDVGSSNDETSVRWMSETGHFDLFIFLGPSLYHVNKQFSDIVGKASMPPLYALGYHQCRWNYNDERDVLSVVENFDSHDIPLDVIWLDIEHTDGKRYFTWDRGRFPDPKQMMATLNETNRVLVTITDPHIKVDGNFDIYRDMNELGLFVKDSMGVDSFEGWCWPGSSKWPDFLNDRVLDYWYDCFSPDRYVGSGNNLQSWIDMNEPSVFNGPEITLPKNTIHLNGFEHRQIHNVYGYFSQKASYGGLLAKTKLEEKTLRPFLLSRSFFAGSQKYGAVWTGDNLAEFEHLEMSVKMLLSLSTSGLSFAGADVGGFFKDTSPKLLKRWYLAGCLQPFFRAHAHIESKRREPYLSSDVANVARFAINLRYQLMPYIYTLFHLHSSEAIPVILPLWAEYQDYFHVDNAYLLGKQMFVSPVLHDALDHSVTFPNDVWFDYFTFEKINQPTIDIILEETTLPVYIRGGSIIPTRERKRRSLYSTINDPITLKVFLHDGNATGKLYIDDYASLDYKKDAYIYSSFHYKDNFLFNKHLHAKMSTIVEIEQIVIIGMEKRPRDVVYVENENNKSIANAVKLDFEVYEKKDYFITTIRKPGFNISRLWKIQLGY